MTQEEKIFEKIRKVLIVDNILKEYVGTRVYSSHISSIVQPKYPAISLFLVNSKADFAMPDVVSMSIQVDIWMQATDYNIEDVLTCMGRVRALLHRANLTDKDIGLTVGQIFESSAGGMMYEADTGLRHLPLRYEATTL